MHLKILFFALSPSIPGWEWEDPNSGNEEMWFNFEALAAGYP